MKYFRLNPECFLTVGTKRSVIQNLKTKEALWLDETNTRELSNSEYNQLVDTDKEIFKVLVQKGWGRISEKKLFVDKIRTINVFREKKLWKETPFISLAVLQLTNKCNQNCSFCEDYFCPICTVRPNTKKPLSSDQWIKIIDELEYFGAKNLLITGGESLLYQEIEPIIKHSLKKGLILQVHTNGLIKPPPILKKSMVSILLTNKNNLRRVKENYRAYKNVILFLLDFDLNGQSQRVNKNWKIIRTNWREPIIDQSKLVQVDLDQFFARKLNDSCLNNKIYIDSEGGIIPCFGSKDEILGNMLTDGLSKPLKKLVNDFWRVPIDEIDESRKCNSCEFKYACTGCRFLKVDTQCKYDTAQGVWN